MTGDGGGRRVTGDSAKGNARGVRQLVMCAALFCAVPLGAQGNRGSSCRVDTTAEWYRSQKAFYAVPGETWSNDSLRRALLGAAGFKADAPFVPELGWRLDSPPLPADTSVFPLLRGMAQRRQWPTRAMVGTAGVHATWLLVQGDSALALAAMRRMMEAGPGESSSAEVAVLDDARRVKVARGQIHGTQFTRAGGGVKVAGKIEDSVHVDMRREGAWLPPIAVSACLARAAAAR